jgi:hypothetical protein
VAFSIITTTLTSALASGGTLTVGYPANTSRGLFLGAATAASVSTNNTT